MCLSQKIHKGTISESFVDDYLLSWLDAFLIDKKAQGVSKGTLHFYEVKFKSFIRFCENEHINWTCALKLRDASLRYNTPIIENIYQ